jgi:hypothetical protein
VSRLSRRTFNVSVASLAAAATARGFSAPAAEEKPANEKWLSLFNGKDLTGWTPKIRNYDLGENFGDTFRVENGVLKVAYDKYDQYDEKFGHIFYKDKFSNYRLRLEYRFVGDQCSGGPGWAIRNSGIMLHCQDPKTMTKDQRFPVSIEVQFLGGDGKAKRTTGNLCTPGTHVVLGGKLHTPHCTNSTSETYHGDQWVRAEVEVHGSGTIKHIINGQTVLTYEQAQLDPDDEDAKKLLKGDDKLIREGYISLQSESHPIEFRNIEVLILDA